MNLEKRIEHLEAENRRIKLMAMAIALLAVQFRLLGLRPHQLAGEYRRLRALFRTETARVAVNR